MPNCEDGHNEKRPYKAAELLDISFRSLRYRLDKLGIEK
ncbi:MAG: hypothetical protein JSV14_05930 [Deltaproteobacteria bacterium]|nr:MAG: hypothetical protein JSV14_05930 [Deltaproteobacteria bacterium]